MVCAWPYEQQWDFCEEKNNVPSLRLADAGYDGEEIKTAFSNRILSQGEELQWKIFLQLFEIPANILLY